MNLFEANDQQLDDTTIDFLDEITKPGAKFDRTKFTDEQDLLKALAKKAVMSDRHINTLESENNLVREDFKRLNDEYKAGLKLQEYLDKLGLDKEPPQRREDTHNSNEDNRMPAINPDDIETLISTKIEQKEQARKETENYNIVQNKIKERFGNDFKTVLKNKAEALGLNEEVVNQMARTNPNLFFKTFDVNTTTADNFQTPPRSDVRSDSFAPKGGEKRNFAYYQKLMKDKPSLLNDPNIRVQMDKDSQALGMEFFSA